jgi:hypothetical protein
MWTYVLLWLRRWQLPRELRHLAIGLIVTRPGAFFLVAGYSESLFLLTALGVLYWCTERRRGWWLLAGLHGFLMTVTRLVGSFISFAAFFPLPDSTAHNQPIRRRLAELFVFTLSGLGALSFFAYCSWRFGHWDLYFETERVGWGHVPDYLAIFRPDTYRLFVPTIGWQRIDVNEVSRLTVPWTAACFLALLALEWVFGRKQPIAAWRQRLPLYWSAGTIFYITVSGLYSLQLRSMLRYNFPVELFLTLALVHLLSQIPPLTGPSRILAGLVARLFCVLSLLVQVYLARALVHGAWVA